MRCRKIFARQAAPLLSRLELSLPLFAYEWEGKSGARLGLYCLGAAGHVAIQWATLGCGITHPPATRGISARERIGKHCGQACTLDAPPKKLDAAACFAPRVNCSRGLASLKKGGRLILGGIHMSDIPFLLLNLLYQERTIEAGQQHALIWCAFSRLGPPRRYSLAPRTCRSFLIGRSQSALMHKEMRFASRVLRVNS